MSNSIVRYSDAELEEFKALILQKMEKTKESLDVLQSQIFEITENTSDEHGGDWVDDSSINSDVEMLNNMAIRQRRYYKDLENALIRIRNKSYGICVISGELIDRKRLMAVPTTTKSLSAKTQSQNKNSDRARLRNRPKPNKPNPEKKIISKVIRKATDSTPKPALPDEEDDLGMEKDLFMDEMIEPTKEDLEDLGGDQDTDEVLNKDDDNPFTQGSEQEED